MGYGSKITGTGWWVVGYGVTDRGHVKEVVFKIVYIWIVESLRSKGFRRDCSFHGSEGSLSLYNVLLILSHLCLPPSYRASGTLE